MLKKIWHTGALLIGLVSGCGVAGEGSSDAEATPTTNQTPLVGKAVGNSELSRLGAAKSVDHALLDESRRLTMARRADFHVALAERLGLTGDRRKRFLSLHAEEEAERLADSLPEESTEDARRTARAAALAELLGAEGLERYFELKKERSTWYRRSTIDRQILTSSTVLRGERSAR